MKSILGTAVLSLIIAAVVWSTDATPSVSASSPTFAHYVVPPQAPAQAPTPEPVVAEPDIQEEPKGKPQEEPKTTKNADETPKSDKPIRDPFTPPAAKQNGEGGSNDPTFRPAPRDVKLPMLSLQGFAKAKGSNETIALLNIDGNGVFVVRAGESISLQQRSQSALVLKIKSISRHSLQVEVGSLGQVLVVR